MTPLDWYLLVILPLVAAGFFALGKLTSRVWVEQRVEELYMKGYHRGFKHGKEQATVGVTKP